MQDMILVLVNLDRDKLGLANANDRRHDQHGLAAKMHQHGKFPLRRKVRKKQGIQPDRSPLMTITCIHEEKRTIAVP